MKTNYLRGFPEEIKTINEATIKVVSSLKKSFIPLTPENIKQVFEIQKNKSAKLAIAMDNYENRLGKEDGELMAIKRMARETILSLFHLLQLDNMEDLENILTEIDNAKEIITIISLFGTASFFIAEFSKSSQLKDNSSDTKEMASNVKNIMGGNKENIRKKMEEKAIDPRTGHEILSSISKSQATIEEHSIKMEDMLRIKNDELSRLLSRMEKTERMFSQLKKHHIDMVKKMDSITEESRTDMLTGMFNWKGFTEAMDKEISKIRRYNTPLSLAKIRVANLAAVAEELGQPIHDKLLIEVANQVRNITRKSDICGRIGGDTIAVIFPNSGLEDSKNAVNKLLATLEEINFTVRGNILRVILSVGLSQVFEDDTLEGIMELVDYLCDKAGKEEGAHICFPEPGK